MIAKVEIPADEVCKDKEALATKEKVMSKQRTNSFFYSISDTFKFLAGTATAIGMTLFAPSLPAFVSGALGALGLKGAFSALIAGTLPALAGGGAVVGGAVAVAGLSLLAFAAVGTLVAIGSQMIASRYYHSANFDALEVNAQHTAKYLSKEIAKNLQVDGACVTHEHHQRPDGRTWQQYNADRNAAVLAMTDAERQAVAQQRN